MKEIAKIGQKNPEAVLRDLLEKMPTIRTLVAVGIHTDGSASVWMSETPDEIERAAIVLLRYATAMQGVED